MPPSRRRCYGRRYIVAAALLGALASGSLAVRPSSVTQAQGASPDNPMRTMMRQMMQGAVPPPGMAPEQLPEPESREAKLMATYCAQCHDLPSPRYKTAAQWPDVFQRMVQRMSMMGGGMMMGMRVRAPGLEEARALLAYLIRQGMVPAQTEELAAGPPADRPAFEAACSDCHALPSPRLHPPEDWPAAVARMDANRQLMNMPQITPQMRDSVLRFLRAASGAAAGKP